jgi:hypothetical protein
MMSSTSSCASWPIALTHRTWSAVWHHLVGLLSTVTVSCEWSTGPVQHCSRLSVRLAGHDGATCPHVLQATMALVSNVMETHKRALETCEPSQIGRLVMPFFIHEARGPLGTTGRVSVPEPSSTGRQGPEP